jgi:hypothetical protein
MPCDTRIKTSVVDMAKVDRKRLAAVLESLGWTLYENTSTRLVASCAYGVWLQVEGASAVLTTTSTQQANDLHAQIRRAYAARTLTEVSARFGFKVQGTEQLLGGAQRVLLRR